jgi:hypothetical protein
MKVNIDLDQSDSYPSMAVAGPEDKPHYPSFQYSGEESLNLPKEGTMLVHFRTVSETEATDENGDDRYTCVVELREILAITSEKKAPTKSGSEAEDALDALMRKRMEEEEAGESAEKEASEDEGKE